MEQFNEIACVSVTEGEHLVHYTLVLGYQPAIPETEEHGAYPPEWSVYLYRRGDRDDLNYGDRYGRVSAWLDDPEDRPPTMDDIDADAWQMIFEGAHNAYGWNRWDNWLSAIKLFGRLLTEAGVK